MLKLKIDATNYPLITTREPIGGLFPWGMTFVTQFIDHQSWPAKKEKWAGKRKPEEDCGDWVDNSDVEIQDIIGGFGQIKTELERDYIRNVMEPIWNR